MSHVAEMLDEVPLFNGVPFETVKMLANYFRVTDVATGHRLFAEGDAGDALMIVLEGSIRVSKTAEDETHTVSIEGRGRVLGEMTLVDGEPRSATCVVSAPGKIAVMTREALQQLEHDHPAVALRFLKLLMRLMSRRLRLTTGQLSRYLD